MSTFIFLEAFPEEDRKLFLETWEKVEAIISKPHSREAQSTLIRVLSETAPKLFNDEAKFAAENGERVKFADLSPEYRQRMVQELQQGIPRDKQIEFNLTELLGYIWRETFDAESWSKAPIGLTEDRLVIDGHQVMDAWQTPIMHGMVDNCVALHGGKASPKVLEIGWGMGIAGRRFVEHGVNYTVVEAHTQVAENARQYLLDKGRVVQSLWQDAKFEPESFDIVFFDAYYTTHDPEKDYLLDVINFFHTLLRNSGIFTYFLGNDANQIPKLLENGFTKVVCHRIAGFEVPPDCTYAPKDMKYWLNVLAIK